jgi:glycosyltransferase involved in cell wall biosynthesis
VTLASFVDGHEPAEAHSRVAALCERVVTVPLSRAASWAQAWTALASATPSQVAFYRSARMRETIRALAAESDALIAHSIRVAPATPNDAPALRVLFQGDAVGLVLARSAPFAPPWKRPGLRWESARADRYLAACTRRFAETWVLSPVDRDHLVARGGVRVECVPHGVDERLFAVAPQPSPTPLAVFVGNLSVPHNVDAAIFAAREIWPAVRAALPEARLVLAGADPAPAVRALADLPGAEVAGFVPDLAALWSRAGVLLAPLRFSAGIQNKALEAMAAGVPVVTVPAVALALDATPGEHLLVAETAPDLAAATVATLRDPAAARERAARARAFVRERFRWGAAVERLESLAAAEPAPPPPGVGAAGGRAS